MGGPGSGVSKKRKTLPRQFRRGAIAKADQRAREVRVYVDRLRQLHEDQGGESQLPATLHSVAERFVFTESIVAKIEAAAWNGGAVEYERYFAAVTTLLRLADRLGYQRRARPLPSLHEYLRSKTEHEPPSSPTEPATCLLTGSSSPGASLVQREAGEAVSPGGLASQQVV